jgi:hypothetical protein
MALRTHFTSTRRVPLPSIYGAIGADRRGPATTPPAAQLYAWSCNETAQGARRGWPRLPAAEVFHSAADGTTFDPDYDELTQVAAEALTTDSWDARGFFPCP